MFIVNLISKIDEIDQQDFESRLFGRVMMKCVQFMLIVHLIQC
jgi:hypothetical protein